jgi:hypothetical protein
MEKGKYKVMGITAASLSAMLAAAVAWGQLDLPRPAWRSEVMALELQVSANTQLILGDKWLRLTAQIKALEAELRDAPTDREMIEKLVVLQLQLREVNGKLR